MNIFNKLWALIVYCLKSIKRGVLALFLTIKLDIEQVFVHLFSGGRALKGSQAFDKQSAFNQLIYVLQSKTLSLVPYIKFQSDC